MRKININQIQEGETLEQLIFRHDSLLALPPGTRITYKEKEYLRDLRIQVVYVNEFDSARPYTDQETLEILKETFYNCTIWDEVAGRQIFSSLKTKLKRNKKILRVLTLLRKADQYSFVASVNIAIVVGKLMMIKNKVDRSLVDFVFYSLIHDIGKIKVADIIAKDGELTETEFQEVRKHPVYSYKLLEQFGLSKRDVLYTMQTHERYDGAGYPTGLKLDEVEPLAQVIAVAETYNALSSFRPHRPAFHPIEVRNKIEEEENRAFGKEYVDLFLERFTPYRTGVMVELNNGLEGKIKYINDKTPLFPTVEVYSPETGEPFTEINLFKNKDLRIARVLI